MIPIGSGYYIYRESVFIFISYILYLLNKIYILYFIFIK